MVGVGHGVDFRNGERVDLGVAFKREWFSFIVP